MTRVTTRGRLVRIQPFEEARGEMLAAAQDGPVPDDAKVPHVASVEAAESLVARIEQGLRQANNGEIATEAEVNAAWARWPWK